jgi:hypothetical protein
VPPPLTDLLGGQLAWRQHVGGHTDAPNMPSFIQWADRNMGRSAAANSAIFPCKIIRVEAA